jgi:hypothetical protein
MHPKCRACARAPRVDRGAGIALARKSYLPPPVLRAFSLLASHCGTLWGLKVSQRPEMFGIRGAHGSPPPLPHLSIVTAAIAGMDDKKQSSYKGS